MQYGRYALVQELGEGGMASVYLAQDTTLSRHVAIKVVKADLVGSEALVARFMNEAKACAALHHSNIIAIHDFGEQEGEQYIVMEYVDGPNLARLVDRYPEGLPVEDVAALILQTADGLAEAHARGIVHRDIKPENLLITREGVVKVTDFGIAHVEEGAGAGLTQTGAILGSPNYMAPEQVNGEKVQPATDLFALGGVLFTCLTGRHPFAGPSISSTMMRICEYPTPELAPLRPGLDPFWQDTLERLLQKKPEHRSFTAATLAAAMRRYLLSVAQDTAKNRIRTLIQSGGFDIEHTLNEESTARLKEKWKSREATRSARGGSISTTGLGRDGHAQTGPGASGQTLAQSPSGKASRLMALVAAVLLVLIVALGGVGFVLYRQLWAPRSALLAEGPLVIHDTSDPEPGMADPGRASDDPSTPQATADEPYPQPKGEPQPGTGGDPSDPTEALIARMRDGWNVDNVEIIAAMSDALGSRSEQIFRLRDEVRRQADSHPSARNLLFQADYFALAADYQNNRYAKSLEACEQYLQAHPGTLFEEAVTAMRDGLLSMRQIGLF